MTHSAERQTLIDRVPRRMAIEHVNALEFLLQRRERVSAVPTRWIDSSMVYRLAIYGVIPPRGPVAAAVVAIYLESTMAG